MESTQKTLLLLNFVHNDVMVFNYYLKTLSDVLSKTVTHAKYIISINYSIFIVLIEFVYYQDNFGLSNVIAMKVDI